MIFVALAVVAVFTFIIFIVKSNTLDKDVYTLTKVGDHEWMAESPYYHVYNIGKSKRQAVRKLKKHINYLAENLEEDEDD